MRKGIIFWLVMICLLGAGCSRPVQEQPETLPVVSVMEQEPDSAPEPELEKLPPIEFIPVILPEPEPELYEPLWENQTRVQPVREIVRTADTVTVFETPQEQDLILRLYQLENGDRVTMGRQRNAIGDLPVYTWELTGNGSVCWYDRTAGQWTQQPLAPGKVSHSMVELTMENGNTYLVYLPKTYRLLENGVMEYLPEQNGALSVAKTGDSWRLSLLASLPDQNCVSDFTMVQGPHAMLDWNHHFCGELWKNYTMETEGKWCFDGYYWPCPDNYEPTGINYLYMCPAAYLVKSFAYAASVHPAADALALAMLDTMATGQNEAGYWPTTPRSSWLFTDYGVEKDFYDTRFNTDLLEIYRTYYTYAGGDVLLDAMQKHIQYFMAYAEQAHFDSVNGGWFIPDYAPAQSTPHCSLNHQLAECIELYRLSVLLERQDLAGLADRMLLAVEDTCRSWISETGDLHYCVFPDGTFGMQDYPYLTYNDLLELQELLIELRGAPNEALQVLMDQKRQWMDANGITGYNH